MLLMVEKKRKKNARERERMERRVNKRKSVGIEKVALLLLFFGIRGITLWSLFLVSIIYFIISVL